MKQIAKTWRRYIALAVIVASTSVATWLIGQVGFFQIAHLKAQDLHFLIRGRSSAPEIMILPIDQKSLDAIPDLQLFWHPYYAEAIRAAADSGARVLGLDVAFGISVRQWEPLHDQILAGTVSEVSDRMPVVCGYVPGTLEKQREWPVPINMVAAALGLSAYANLTVDPDDFVRRQEMVEASDPGNPTPPARGLALRVVEKYLKSDARLVGGSLVLDGRPVLTSASRTIVINYTGPPGTVPRVPLIDFLEAARAGRKDQLRKWVADKIVLIGPDNSIEDRHATPFYTLFSGTRWNTAGVEIHANTIHTLISRNYLSPAPSAARLLALLVTTSLTACAAVSLAPSTAAWCLAALVTTVLVITHLLFRTGTLLSTSELLIGYSLSLLCSLAYRFLTAERMQALFHKAVSLFVGKSVARSLEESQSISLGGTRQLATVLFSDIRGFTAFCDAKDPGEVVALLNEYFARMVSIIIAAHGHVNKFIGDGILAVFSDQDATLPGDHAIRAVRCGVKMAAQGGTFRTGVGIHTGLVVMGNVGSSEKMEYTVLGDTVNVASRLESLNKEQKTSLLISEGTNTLVAGEVDTIPLGVVSIRGQTKPMAIYTAASLAPARDANLKCAEEKVV